jgi:hypothetical protein
MKEILVGKFQCHFSQVSPALLLGVAVVYCQKSLVDQSEKITTYMGTHDRSVMIEMYGTPCAIKVKQSRYTPCRRLGGEEV